MSTRRLSFETLENRRLLASVVGAVVNGKGDLIVTGDKGDNKSDQVQIEGQGPNSVKVTGLGDTFVNAAGTKEITVPVTRHISVNLKNGDDEVYVLDLEKHPGKLTIKTGSGVGTVGVFDSVVVGKVDIQTGKLYDQVALENVEGSGDISIKTFDREDEVGLAGVEVGRNLSVNTGNASFRISGGQTWIRADLVGVTGSRVGGSMAITTGTGNDFVGMGDNFTRDEWDWMGALFTDFGRNIGAYQGAVDIVLKATIKTGSGNDTLDITNGTAQSLSLDTGAGVDSGQIMGDSGVDAISAKMGSGSGDYLKIAPDEPIELKSKSLLDGGSGVADTLVMTGIIENVKIPLLSGFLVIKNWEWPV